MGKHSRKGVITDVILAEGRTPPVIVGFQNGMVDPSEASCLSMKVHRNLKTKQRMVSTRFDGIGYRGTCKNTPLRKFIAIMDNSTREVKLVEAATCSLNAVFDQRVSVKTDMSAQEARGKVAKEYGTKARRMRAILAETLKLDSDEVKRAASAVEITEEQLNHENQTKVDPVFEVLPPHNREGKVVEEVYKMDDILVDDILHYFDEEVKRIMDTPNEELKENNLSEFFLTSWNSLQHRDGMDQKITKLKALLYIECVGHLLQATVFNLKKAKFSTCYFSEPLSEYIMEQFTSKAETGRICSKAERDKAICYILVLCFQIFDYKVLISSLIKITKSSITRLNQLCRVIGAKVDKQHLATLRLPLAEPPTPRKAKKKS